MNASDKTKEIDSCIVIEDLNGHSVDDIRCVNCSGMYCYRRNIRIVEGKPLAVCNLKIETLDELSGGTAS